MAKVITGTLTLLKRAQTKANKDYYQVKVDETSMFWWNTEQVTDLEVGDDVTVSYVPSKFAKLLSISKTVAFKEELVNNSNALKAIQMREVFK